MQNITQEVIELLKKLIATPSFSKEENQTADLIADFIRKKDYSPFRKGNNVWVESKKFDKSKATILLNSHHDTVKPNQGYTLNPFEPLVQEGKLFGLGSNDAGASLVGLLATFLYLDAHYKLPYNLIYAATAEEEISGTQGMESILEDLGRIDLGIVGEPTQMQMAIAEKGLLVLDIVAKGKAGHAAREEGENAIYKAIQDIHWLQNFEFPLVSPLLGKVKMTVTQIQGGYQHNVVPDTCSFVVDVRTSELYSNQEIFEIIQKHIRSEAKARSFRLNSSYIPVSHPIVKRGIDLGLNYYGSPTSSDQAVMPFTTIKIGIGDSARSHTANEFVYLEEIEKGIETYVYLLEGLAL